MATSATSPEDNPRKRGRTACTRCKTRKKRCDTQWPTCVNCEKAGLDCDISNVREDDNVPIEYGGNFRRLRYDQPGGQPLMHSRYIGTLEDRVAQLEIENAELKRSAETAEARHSNDTTSMSSRSQLPSDLSRRVSRMDANELSTSPDATASVSLAANLDELVQATVWNKTLAPSSRNHADVSSLVTPGEPAHGQPISHQELRAHRPALPTEADSHRMITAYLNMLHTRYPFLDEASLWRLHDDRKRLVESGSSQLSVQERFGIFKLFMVYAIGATLLHLTQKSRNTAPEVSNDAFRRGRSLPSKSKLIFYVLQSFYMTALQHVSAAREARSVHNIEAMTLLVLYHLRSSSSHGMWYMIGLAMRTCIDLGLHREPLPSAVHENDVQLRRRLFWTVYSLDRVISISLGRPFSITDRQIDVKLPDDHDDSQGQEAEGSSRADVSQAVDLVRLRRIESQICHSVYRVDVPRASLLSKMPHLYERLEAWKTSVHYRYAAGAPLDYLMLHYHKAVRMLIEPFLPLLQPSNAYYQRCLQSAGEICQAHKRLHQRTNYGHSFIAVQTVFVAGLTMIHCLWTNPQQTWSARLSEAIRACSSVLFVMSERAAWVEKHRDAFELLVSAAMSRVAGDLSRSDAGIAEKAAQAAGASSRPDQWGTGSPRGAGRMFNAQDVIKSSTARHNSMNGTTHHSYGPAQYAAQSGIGGYGTNASGQSIAPSYQYSNQTPANFFFGDGAAYADPNMAPEQNDAMRIVNELAQWIEQDQNTGLPVWMPNFEHLESGARDWMRHA